MTLSAMVASLAVLVSVVACSASRKADASNTEAPERVVVSESGRLRVTAAPARASQKQALDLTVRLIVVDSTTEKPVDGLDWTVVPFMPSMGHGTSVAPEVHPLFNGVYQVDHVNLFMPGSWEIRATSTGARSDKISIAVDVQS